MFRNWDVTDYVALTVIFTMLAGLAIFLTWAIQSGNADSARFKARCDAVHGRVMETRDVDFCLNGNTILFMNN